MPPDGIEGYTGSTPLGSTRPWPTVGQDAKVRILEPHERGSSVTTFGSDDPFRPVMPDETLPKNWERTWPEKPMPGGGLIIPGTYRRGWKVEDLPTSSGPITPLTEEEADLLLGRPAANQEGLTPRRR